MPDAPWQVDTKNHEGNKTQLQFSGNDSTNERDDWVILHFVAVMYWPRVYIKQSICYRRLNYYDRYLVLDYHTKVDDFPLQRTPDQS